GLWRGTVGGSGQTPNDVAGVVMLIHLTLACAAVLLLLAWRVDINEASMNPFYCNRLVRCYLGAARDASGKRRPNRFTGFDFADDFALADLKPNGLARKRSERMSKVSYAGPVPIVNTALNLVGADNAALEERRATSFFFTPYKS